ncbi:hypothetical protein HYU20_01640 [Candidatus Woesearchaeota archaeon]|nr:hypothetical protein [Candidatus Woesearchaeota archaeon]
MPETLELRLSEVIGNGNNRTISFSFRPFSGKGERVPLVEIVLNDDRIVEIPLNAAGKSKYGLEVGDQKLVVYPRSRIIRVVNSSGEILREQNYKAGYANGAQR